MFLKKNFYNRVTMVDYEFINGQRKNKILVYRNYLFNLRENKESREIWRCRIRTCKARCFIFP